MATSAFLIGAMALAMALRLYQIDTVPLWGDEMATLFFARLDWADLFGAFSRVEPNPPGYYALIKLLRPALGESAMALRLPSALAGTMALLPLFAITRRGFGPRAAGVAVLLGAVMVPQVREAQNARCFSLLFLLCLCLIWLLDRVVSTPRPRGMRLAGLTGAIGLVGTAMLYLHATALFPLAAGAVYAAVMLSNRGEGWRRAGMALVAAYALMLVLAAWWLARLLEIAGTPGHAAAWIPPLGVAYALGEVSTALAMPYWVRGNAVAWVGFGGALVAALVLAVREGNPRGRALLAALAAGLALLLVASWIQPILLARTALFLLAFALPLYGWALAWPRPAWLGVVATGILLAVQAYANSWHYRTEATTARFDQPWDRAIHVVDAAIRPGEHIIILGSFEAQAIALYGSEKLGRDHKVGVPVSTGLNLGSLVVAHMPGVAPLDLERGCPDATATGLWPLGSRVTPEAGADARLHACGWEIEATRRAANIRMVHWVRRG